MISRMNQIGGEGGICHVIYYNYKYINMSFLTMSGYIQQLSYKNFSHFISKAIMFILNEKKKAKKETHVN